MPSRGVASDRGAQPPIRSRSLAPARASASATGASVEARPPLRERAAAAVPQDGSLLGSMLARAVEQRARAVRGPRSPVLQRYSAVAAGSLERWHYNYLTWDEPAAPTETFFTHQESVQGSFFDNQQAPNLVHTADASLLVSGDGRIAIEAAGEAKTFFADMSVVDAGNAALSGALVLQATRRYLWDPARKMRLFEVQPSLPASSQVGLDVRTPQRCNECAGLASGVSLKLPMDTTAKLMLAAAVDAATGGLADEETGETWQAKLRRLDRESYKASLDPYALERFTGALVRRALRPDIAAAVQAHLASRHANAGLDPPPGAAIGIFSIADSAMGRLAMQFGIDPFPYHFATVVARSGSDYVTFENYARRDPVVSGTDSGGDPLHFFRMYNTTTPPQRWHDVQVASGGLIGAPVSLVYG